tara:strand:+ start:160 stop:1446 length:1287 start_codon:yes stop_codon:yes gene_type:complete
MIGKEIHKFAAEMFPICRSIMGNGNRQTLKLIQKHIPIKIHEVPTGYQAYDWQVPQEWNINDAYILDPNGNKIVDFNVNNLHVMGYSVPVNKQVTLEELQKHLYSAPDKPTAIPYVTSYYKRRWGFCLTHEQRQSLQDGLYTVYIDSSLKDGSLSYGELIIPGETKQEVFLTTYICHPSMANNECSGPAVTTYLAKWLLEQKRKYTYRIVFAPETIGAIVYISKNYDKLVKNVIAGFNLTCVGDNNNYSLMPSRLGNTITDKIARHVLDNFTDVYKEYSFLYKGSDERQYCHPMVDLPLVSLMRSKYGTYAEYHNSMDNLEYVTPDGLYGGYMINKNCIEALECNEVYTNCYTCEPKMMKHDLVPKDWHLRDAGAKTNPRKHMRDLMNILFYCDGKNDIIDIANIIGIDFKKCYEYVKLLTSKEIITK